MSSRNFNSEAIQKMEEKEREEKKEEEEKNKFIMLESLKYDRAIKNMDRLTGLKENLM